MRTNGNHGSTIAYELNCRGEWREQLDFAEARPGTGITAATTTISAKCALFREMDEERRLLFENTARAMAGLSDEVRQRYVHNCCHRAGQGLTRSSRRCPARRRATERAGRCPSACRYSHDATFSKGRVTVCTALRADWSKRYFVEIVYTHLGGGRYNLLADRSNVFVVGGVSF